MTAHQVWPASRVRQAPDAETEPSRPVPVGAAVATPPAFAGGPDASVPSLALVIISERGGGNCHKPRSDEKNR